VKQVLVVDDEPQMLIAVSETLKRKGYAITTAASGLDAVTKLKERFYHLVISDVRMPNMDGIELLRKVKSMSPQTTVILLTAFGTVQNAVEAMKLGAFDYLLKPFTAEDLERLVKRALSEGDHASRKPLNIVTQDEKMLQILELARQAAASSATVLIQAESGTGKELLARSIHDASARQRHPFVAVNCAALPENLLESELFGHEKGAFTGAAAAKPGKFELANQGTILLDEISEMAPILQAKILRVLQEREVDRLGGARPTPINVRVIATTNKDLSEMVQHGDFRQDLFYRLNVIPLKIPPLRHRRSDIPLLVEHFCRKHGNDQVRFSDEALGVLSQYDWPGNVRELENIVQRSIALAKDSVITPSDLFIDQIVQSQSQELKAGTTIKELEQKLITMTLEQTGGNRTYAAQMLGISLRTLRNKLREYRTQGMCL
jgi:DNA-binding NtrC family response regulator